MSFCIGSFPVANRPDPEGLSSSDLYSPMTMTSGVPPLPYILDIGDNDEQEPLEQQEELLPILNRIRFSVSQLSVTCIGCNSNWINISIIAMCKHYIAAVNIVIAIIVYAMFLMFLLYETMSVMFLQY